MVTVFLHIAWMIPHMDVDGVPISCSKGPLSHWCGHYPTWVLAHLLTGLRCPAYRNQSTLLQRSRFFLTEAMLLPHRGYSAMMPPHRGCNVPSQIPSEVLPHRGLGAHLIRVRSTMVRTILGRSKASSSHSLLLLRNKIGRHFLLKNTK